jgi:hypothetical protein
MNKEILEEIGNELITEIRKRLSDKGINNTMQASQSLNKKATETNLQITGLRYIGALDKGRRPGRFPPVDAIRDWVAQKLGISGNDQNSIAYLIGRKIANEGTSIYQDRTQGIELESIVDIGIDLIKKRITAKFLIETKGKIIDLSKGATA